MEPQTIMLGCHILIATAHEMLARYKSVPSLCIHHLIGLVNNPIIIIPILERGKLRLRDG